MRKAYGWSLLELIIVLSLISFLMLSGVASFSDYLNRAHTLRMSDVVIKSLILARHEAITRKTIVTFCPVTNNKCTQTTSSRVAIFLDKNRSRSIENNEEIIRSFSISQEGSQVVLKASFARHYFRFKKNGHAMETGRILYCPKTKPNTMGQIIKLNYTGRAYLLKDDKKRKAQLKCPNT
jgi:type IV fimbrial biogenesis protein FimT